MTGDDELMIGSQVLHALRAILEAKLKKNPRAGSVRHLDHRCKAVWVGIHDPEPELRMEVFLPIAPGDVREATLYSVRSHYVEPTNHRLAATLEDHLPELALALKKASAA